MKKPKSGMQWKVIKGVTLDALERTCEEWTYKGWLVFAILGPLNSGFAVVLHRMVLRRPR